MINYEELTKDHIEEIAELYVNAFNAESWNDTWTVN